MVAMPMKSGSPEGVLIERAIFPGDFTPIVFATISGTRKRPPLLWTVALKATVIIAIR
jgi:hypothetical protein